MFVGDRDRGPPTSTKLEPHSHRLPSETVILEGPLQRRHAMGKRWGAVTGVLPHSRAVPGHNLLSRDSQAWHCGFDLPTQPPPHDLEMPVQDSATVRSVDTNWSPSPNPNPTPTPNPARTLPCVFHFPLSSLPSAIILPTAVAPRDHCPPVIQALPLTLPLWDHPFGEKLPLTLSYFLKKNLDTSPLCLFNFISGSFFDFCTWRWIGISLDISPLCLQSWVCFWWLKQNLSSLLLLKMLTCQHSPSWCNIED